MDQREDVVEIGRSRKDLAVEDVLAIAGREGLAHVVLVGLTDDKEVVFRCSEMTDAEANWLLDQGKLANWGLLTKVGD